jgi:sugar lactone lactonase YvrE/enterochelin esterase-like enzyme
MPTARLCILLFIFLVATATAATYELGPDSKAQPGVPQGKVTQHRWSNSKIFPGSERDYWVYVPAQYDGSTPACVMVFQDGGGFVKENGEYRATVVMDNLIAKKDMPVTIGVFINPGDIPAAKEGLQPRVNRSFEYDTPDDKYARFLLEEILPEVGKSYKLTSDATGRGIIGASSGGICAFTAAWERPDAFSRVISFVGSFTDLRGGFLYPPLVRKCEPKAIRVYLQDGVNDLDHFAGSWLMANRELDAALNYAGYEHEFVVGDEGHNGKHGAAILPEAMRYIWKDYPNLPKKGAFERAAKDPRPNVMTFVDPAEGWQLVGEGYKFTEGPASDASGTVYFTDVPGGKIYKVDLDGKVSVFVEDSKKANGMKFGPDGKLYAVQGGTKKIVAYDVSNAKEETVAEDVDGNDLVVAHDGGTYVTEPNRHQLTYISPKREKRVVDKGMVFPNGLTLSPDQSQLVVADMRTRNLFAFRIESDGSLGMKSPFFTLSVPATMTDCGADGLTVDTEGRIYSTSHLGVQICDKGGPVNAVLAKPQRAWLSNVCFGGKEHDTLFATSADKVYKRKMKTQGALAFEAPIVQRQRK